MSDPSSGGAGGVDADESGGEPDTPAGTWLRLSCPVCRGWMGVPNNAEGTHREAWVARRIDVFVHRHRHHRLEGSR
jgi:hypothetical protein